MYWILKSLFNIYKVAEFEPYIGRNERPIA